jgi:VWFA-related protein
MKLLLAAVLAASQLGTQPLIRVTTRLVEISVIVRDRNGPVRGLTKADFQVFDRGKPREIAFFSEQDATSARKAPDSLPAHVFSNRPEHRGIDPANATIVLFDGVNTSAADQIWAKGQFLRFLGQIQPQDRIAVYSLGRNLRVLSDFTNDPRRLAATVGRFRARVDAAPDAPLDRADTGNEEDAVWNEFLQRVEDEMEERRIRHTADAMESIARQIGSIPGRKNLIWISAAFPFENRDPRFPRLYGADAERIAKALSAANIAAYPVDARGLMALGGATTADNRAPAAPLRGPPPPVSLAAGRSVGSQNPAAGLYAGVTPSGHPVMDMVAQATGGRAFKNTNDIQGAIRTVLEEAAATYTLAFAPDAGALDSKFHPVKVTVGRSGVEVRHRDGYTASPDPPQDEKSRAAEIRSAVVSPLESGGVRLKVKVERTATLDVAAIVAAEDIEFETRNGRWTAQVEVALAQRAADGRDLGTTFYSVRPDFDESRHAEAMRKGVGFSKSVAVAAGATELRVVVVDRATGRLGSVIVRLP